MPNGWEKMISIPYGAIKRASSSAICWICAVISIPYGAIKRQHPVRCRLCFREFQFLMVRLKGPFNCFIKYSCDISIPYGAIKSYTNIPHIFHNQSISIPYGAIKSSPVTETTVIPFIFQFLMVRLKAVGCDNLTAMIFRAFATSKSSAKIQKNRRTAMIKKYRGFDNCLKILIHNISKNEHFFFKCSFHSSFASSTTCGATEKHRCWHVLCQQSPCSSTLWHRC